MLKLIKIVPLQGSNLYKAHLLKLQVPFVSDKAPLLKLLHVTTQLAKYFHCKIEIYLKKRDLIRQSQLETKFKKRYPLLFFYSKLEKKENSNPKFVSLPYPPSNKI